MYVYRTVFMNASFLRIGLVFGRFHGGGVSNSVQSCYSKIGSLVLFVRGFTAMPPVEIVGLLITAALVGALIGGFLTARSARASRRAAHEEQFIGALIMWLACRQTWRKAARTLIRKVRAVAQEPRDSIRFENLCKSARVARKRFRKATEQLTLAEAAMETWRGDALSALSDPPPQPTAGQVRRLALRGGAERIELMIQRLELAENADLEWVRNERVQMRARRSLVAHSGVWAQRIIWKVVRAWERPR